MPEKDKRVFNPVPIIQITDNCKRHLTYHIYPTLHSESWKWNINQLHRYWSLFNGYKALAIVYDKKTHGPELVKQYLLSKGMQFDTILTRRNNVNIREVNTWLPLLEALNVKELSNNDFIFSAHAKGVRHETQESHIKYWALCMYHANLHNWDLVRQYLERFLAVGIFRRYNAFNTVTNFCWHFSGTFFWWRPYDIINRGNWKVVDQAFFGTESWLGHQMPPDYSACLFNDNCNDLYHKQYWDDIVLPQWYKMYDKDSLNEN